METGDVFQRFHGEDCRFETAGAGGLFGSFKKSIGAGGCSGDTGRHCRECYVYHDSGGSADAVVGYSLAEADEYTVFSLR